MTLVAAFDGVGDYASIADNAALRTPDTALTVAGWFYRVAAGDAYHTYFIKVNNGASSPYYTFSAFRDATANGVQAAIQVGGTNHSAFPGPNVTTGAWFFIALTWASGGPMSIRAWNAAGTLVGTQSTGNLTGSIGYTAHPFEIAGNTAFGEYLNGYAACVGIHNAVLTDAQLRSDANSWFNTGRPPVQLSGPFWSLQNTWASDAAYGASGHTLTALGNATFSDQTVPWTPPAGGNNFTGAIAQTLPSLSQVATGTVTDPVDTGTIAQTLPSLSQDANGTFDAVLGIPQNLTAVAVSTSQIDLDWDTVVGAAAYDIERDSEVIVLNHPTNSYSDTGLSPSTEYTYRVRSVA